MRVGVEVDEAPSHAPRIAKLEADCPIELFVSKYQQAREKRKEIPMRTLFGRLFDRKRTERDSFISLGRATVARYCCHPVKKAEGRVHAFDEWTDTTMPKNEQGGYDFCLQCLGQMAIRCGWCDRPIFIGDPITLYFSRDPYLWVAPTVAIFRFEHMERVGCGRTDCAESGVDYVGVWVPTGVQREGRWLGGVKRRVSILDVVMANNQSIIVSDLSQVPTLPGVTLPERMPLVWD